MAIRGEGGMEEHREGVRGVSGGVFKFFKWKNEKQDRRKEASSGERNQACFLFFLLNIGTCVCVCVSVCVKCTV